VIRRLECGVREIVRGRIRLWKEMGPASQEREQDSRERRDAHGPMLHPARAGGMMDFEASALDLPPTKDASIFDPHDCAAR